jgi:hypothetical protein
MKLISPVILQLLITITIVSLIVASLNILIKIINIKQKFNLYQTAIIIKQPIKLYLNLIKV